MKLRFSPLLFLAATATGFAQQASPPDPTAVPPAYYNARHATDGQPPQPPCTPGELRSYATIHSLGFEWDLAGDTDHDATCAVSWREKGDAEWVEGFPLMRIDYQGWYAAQTARQAYNMVAGSVMFLEPGTQYEVKLTLNDPDGGGETREQSLTTRPVPTPGRALRTLHVRPGVNLSESDGSEERPFPSVAAADGIARPGDMFLLHAGEYGKVELRGKGDTGAYVVWKPAGDGPAVFEQIVLNEASHLWLEGLTFQKKFEDNGLRCLNSCPDNVVSRCVFRGFHYSINLRQGSDGWYIADNDIIGDKPEGISGEGIELAHTSHHTVCHNIVRDVADCVSYPDTNCDIFGNDFYDYSDDGVEPDYGYANNRIWNNRLCGPMGVTFQAQFCGPWYIIRNQVLAKNNVFKLRVQDRFVCVNNTFAGWSTGGPLVNHAHGLLTSFSRNNLWIHLGGSEFLWTVSAPDNEKTREYSCKYVIYDTFKADWRTDVDYDGFDWSAATVHRQVGRATPFMWQGTRLHTLPDLARVVGIEKHGREVNRATLWEAKVLPATAVTNYRKALILAPGSDAIDAGVPVPGLTGTFAGQAPDLGAYESGQVVPPVGPRPAK